MSGFRKRNNLLIPSDGVYNCTAIPNVGTDRVGANVTVSTTFSWKGNSSFKLTPGTSGVFDIYCGITAARYYTVPSKAFTASWYIRREDAGPIVLSDINAIEIGTTTDGFINETSMTLTPSFTPWYLASGTILSLLGTGTLTFMNLIFSSTGNLIGHTMYIDAWQIEANPYATPWESITIGDIQHIKAAVI
jgi:hypothetical protein